MLSNPRFPVSHIWEISNYVRYIRQNVPESITQLLNESTAPLFSLSGNKLDRGLSTLLIPRVTRLSKAVIVHIVRPEP